MEDEIVNKVAKSKLVTIDLEDFYPLGDRVVFDISKWLHEGLILKEKEFREAVENCDWSQYKDCYVALICATDAIIPSWAYLLLVTKLSVFAKKTVVGDLTLLETIVYQEIIATLEIEEFRNKPVIIKGCSNKPIPASAYTLLIEKIQPVVRSIMFGEACSTVPLYKNKNR
ncbi:DUF2480 family protein [Tenacibaculum maritimum]|uniref:DUF2480 family protein n=1 Tax=Tenacibaculum maritimum TaxID=107401 RepID=UPI00387631EA